MRSMKTTIVFGAAVLLAFAIREAACADDPADEIDVAYRESLKTEICPELKPRGEVRQITVRTSAQMDIAGEDDIIDNAWIAIGSGHRRGAELVVDTETPYRGKPVFRFSARDDAVNRIELSEVYGSVENLASLTKKERDAAIAIKDGYINSEVGRFGDTVTYEWSTRFPEAMTDETKGIFAQWHGRPDRTLIQDEKGTRVLSAPEFLRLQESIEFREDGWGYNRETGERTSLRVDCAAGGPIGAFKVGMGHIYLLARSEAARRSDSSVKLRPKPTHDIGHSISQGSKEAALVWKLPLSRVPIDEWMDCKVRIHYSEYAADADRVTGPGRVTVWMNGKQVADWKGNIGKNDILGPYFKFGIYKPGPDGFKVDHSGYKRTIERTRKGPAQQHLLLSDR